ncbi:hypothetical protein F3G61_30825, partial [Pseudomonas aeruginosa]
MTGHQPIVIASVYLPPDTPLLSSDLETLFGMGDSVILAGDLNCHHTRWNCHRTNVNGRRLDAFIDDLTFEIFNPPTPTYYPYNAARRPSTIDLALLRNVTLRLRSIEAMSELDSDHRPVVMQLGRPLNREPDTRTMVDWKKLGTCLADTAPPILPCGPDSTPSPEDTVESINIFTDHVSTAIIRSSKQVDVEDCFHRIRLSPDLRDLLRVRNAAIRAHDRYPTDSNRTRMRRLQREVKSRLSDARNENWDSYLEELAPTHQAYWQLARTLKSETIVTMPPLVRPSGQPPAFDDDDKAELLADALQEQCTTSTQ